MLLIWMLLLQQHADVGTIYLGEPLCLQALWFKCNGWHFQI